MFHLFQRANTVLFVVLSVALISCATPRESGNKVWEKELLAEKFSAFLPPREGSELGNIISFDSQGREVLIAKAGTCLPHLSVPQPVNVALLTTSSTVDFGGGLSANVAEALRGKVDLSLLAKSKSNTFVSLRLGNPQITRHETLLLKNAIKEIDRNSNCYKAVSDPKNLIVISTLGAKTVAYDFKDASNHEIKLTADILQQANVTPELQRKYEGHSSLIIEQPLLIGYRALKATELPGLNKDQLKFDELNPEEIESYRTLVRHANRPI